MRSLPQNDTYWGLIVDVLANEWGWNKDDLHKYLKDEFLPKKIVFVPNKDGHVIEKKIKTKESTTELTTIEFNDFMSTIRTWASIEHGIWLGEPGEDREAYL